MRHAWIAVVLLVLSGAGSLWGQTLRVDDLRCEYLKDPLGIDTAQPRLSWTVQSHQRAQRQTAYELLVASSPERLRQDQGDLWQVAQVASDETAQVVYAGKPLGSRQGCFWKVRAWDRDGNPGDWSAPALWEMGLLKADDWKAHWIEADLKPATAGAVPMFRKAVELADKPIAKARLYATALGLYELRINGRRVGDYALAPEWTDYRKRVRYQVYDVASMLKPGQNALAALLADGWYCGHIGNGGFQAFGKRPALFTQLEVTYADGSQQRVVTDETWKIHAGPVLSSDFMLGESYDARREIPGWDRPGLDDAAWAAATVRQEPARAMDGQVVEPVRETGRLTPKSVKQPKPGHWTFDLGQNMVGVVRLAVAAPAGTKITLRHAEMLNPDGTIYTTNLRGATSVDTYVAKGGGTEVWQPAFTFHGFRYVELSGLPGKPGPDAVTGIVLGSDMPRVGRFACSDPRINQLQSNITWGQRGNYLSIPTDCPQRDERLGWMGDAQVFVRTATDNADVAAFFTKWLVDVDDGQSPDGAFSDVNPNTMGCGSVPAWADAGVICPWTIYQVYGDRRILERHLPAMTRWVEWCRKHSTGLIRDKDRGNDYGDWLSIGADTPKDLIGTAYFAYSAHLVAQSYRAIGKTEEAAKYQQLFDDIKAAFNKRYVAADGRIRGNTQCCYAMALKFELLPEELRAKAARYLQDDVQAHGWHVTTGFVGVSYMLPVLTKAGMVGTAYRLLMQDTFPSWLFSVKHGATTIWERWDGWTPEKGFQDPGMNSFNHYALGSCGQWLFDTVAGIGLDPQEPGFRHIILHPRVGGGLSWASATFRSIRGPIASAWRRKDGVVTLEVTIPANTTATVYLPAAEAGAVTESGKPAATSEGVKFLRAEQGEAVFEIGSGSYTFVCPLVRK
jgi:alpha-L-rhamnosidase